MKKHIIALALLLASAGAMGQRASSLSDTQVTLLSLELDGSQTLRVSGLGRNLSDAKEQAKKNAVYAVIFQGIASSQPANNQRPLLTEVNAHERYEDYFNAFFTDGGEYLKYVSLDDTKKRSKQKIKNKVGMKYTMTVRVKRSELKARLKADGVLK